LHGLNFRELEMSGDLMLSCFSRKELEAKDEEKRKIEEENRLREEAAQRELEAYMKMKETFVVEEEGCEVNNDEEEQNLLEKFVNHIKVSNWTFSYRCYLSLRILLKSLLFHRRRR